MILFPEFSGMEWMWLFPGSIEEQWREGNLNIKDYLNFFSCLALRHKIYIISGTVPYLENNTFYNRSFIFSPTGNIDFQDKINLTLSEKELNLLQPGNHIKILKRLSEKWVLLFAMIQNSLSIFKH